MRSIAASWMLRVAGACDERRRGLLYTFLGAVLGILLLHPVTMVIYWFEFRGAIGSGAEQLWDFVAGRVIASFSREMLSMSVGFAVLGAVVGFVYALLDARIRRSASVISHLEREVARDVPTLIRLGENDHVEFKASARWDERTRRVNRALGEAIARAIAAFANLGGGSILIGVADSGRVSGIEADYGTLKRPSRDGFTQLLISLVRERLGADICRLIHVLFVSIEGRDVCRVIVEPSRMPVYFRDGGRSRFFVRTGNGNSELDAREVIHFVAGRWGARDLPGNGPTGDEPTGTKESLSHSRAKSRSL